MLFRSARLDRVFHDDRWRGRLDAAQLQLVTEDSETARLMEVFGAGFEQIDELAARRADELPVVPIPGPQAGGRG